MGLPGRKCRQMSDGFGDGAEHPYIGISVRHLDLPSVAFRQKSQPYRATTILGHAEVRGVDNFRVKDISRPPQPTPEGGNYRLRIFIHQTFHVLADNRVRFEMPDEPYGRKQ